MLNASRGVSIVGVGYSTCGRNTGLSYPELARQAGMAAMADAGMTPADINGVSTWTGMGDNPPSGDAMDLAYSFGFTPVDWFYTVGAAPAFVDPFVHSVAAVSAGLCDTCIVFRVLRRQPTSSDQLTQRRVQPPSGPMRVGGRAQFSAPYGSMAAAAGIAGFQMRAHMARYGTTEEQFGINAVNQRYHASLNDDALLRDPLTLDDYLNARYVSKPARLYDCDYPVDAGSAVIITTAERARDWQQKPVDVEACTLSAIRDFDMSLLDDFTSTSPAHCAEKLWSRTDLTPADVDVAELYDGFTIITFQWLEALGLCGPGEAGPFIEAGNTRLGGSLPLNTDGGACNVGRRHGANFCIEAVHQLRGESGVRQVPGAEVAVWSNAVGCFSGSVLLTAG
jgi:acetyl-CoA acetyltransferase